MTWGELRLQLQTAASGVSLDLLDEFLNSRYEQVLEANDWTGVKAAGLIQTMASYSSGADSATLTTASNAVTGVGTNWAASLVGMRFYRPGDKALYTVASVLSTTSLTLDRPYEGFGNEAPGTVYAGSAYVLMRNVYPLPGDCGSIVEILDPVSEFPLSRLSQSEMDASAGARTLVDNPTAFALREDTPETAPPVLHQVEFFPPPRYARGFPITYLRAAYGFDGQNTGSGPLPWVSMSVLLYGCRADIAAYQAAQAEGGAAGVYLAQAKMYEGKFQEELARLLRVEHQQRRKKGAMRMADRFTRHRLERASRGMNNYWGRGQGGPV